MAKRPCFSPSLNPQNMNSLTHSLLELLFSSSISIQLSFENLIESAPSDSEQYRLIDRALYLGSALLDAGNRSARKRATLHNSIVWSLPPDLTIKIFSMLDTQSLCYISATCSLFNKCAIDPLCYSNIDLTTPVPKVNNVVVSTMIQRAGRDLQSLKLGILPGPATAFSSFSCTTKYRLDAYRFSPYEKRLRQEKEMSVLTRSCLSSLTGDNGTSGALLRKLHLYNIERMDNAALNVALSACPSLLDLEMVGLQIELKQTLMSVSTNCHSIARLVFESSKTGRDDSLKSPTCVNLVNNCPHLTSLALRGFKLPDHKIRILMKGLQKLKFADFSTSYVITGSFLRNLGSNASADILEIIILRDCMHLKEVEVGKFLMSLLAGDFKHLRHIDISNKDGLAAEGDWYDRCNSSSIIPLKQVLDLRPDICLLAEFPSEGSLIEHVYDSEYNSENSLPSPMSSHTSNGSTFTTLSESSYNSDLGSGNEYGQDGFFYESSDELDPFSL